MKLRIVYLFGLYLCLSSANAFAKSVDFCNHSLSEKEFIFGFDDGTGLKSRGYYQVEIGECLKFRSIRGDFYYRSQTNDKLVKWLNDTKRTVVASGFHRFCESSNGNAFAIIHPRYQSSNNRCSKKVGLKRYRLKHQHTNLYFFEKNHKGIASQEAKYARKQLVGRMQFENRLKRNIKQNKGFPWRIGATLEDDKTYYGAKVVSTFTGMPLSQAGVQQGDLIVQFGGYTIDSVSNLLWVLRNISIYESSPLKLIFDRNGETYETHLIPTFFNFLHAEYDPRHKASVFAASTLDYMSFGTAKYLLCGAGNALKSLSESAFIMQQYMESTGNCADRIKWALSKVRILYADTDSAALWASFIIPGAAVPKTLKLSKLKNFKLSQFDRRVHRKIHQTAKPRSRKISPKTRA